MIEEPHDHGRLPVPGDVAAVQRAVDEATAGIGSLAAVVVSLIKCWREDVGSVVSDVMGIIAGVGVDDGEKAVALLLPFAVRLRAMQPDLTGAASAQEEDTAVRAHGATLDPDDALLFRFTFGGMGLGHDTVLDMLVGVTTRRLLVCQATELGDPDRAALVELVDDYLGESAELLPAWSRHRGRARARPCQTDKRHSCYF